ncbi:MAG: FtsX-like permease family protein [Chthoniobacterales bacterium]
MIAQYSRLFRWHVLRYLARHPLLATLNVATVALGVALYLAIQIANGSANRAFEASVDVVAGKAQLEVTAPADDLPDRLLPQIAHTPGVAAATPIVRGFVTLPQFPGEYLDLLGIDVFTNEPFRTFQLTDFRTQDFDVQNWLREPRTVALSEEFAQRHHLHAGDKLAIQINGQSESLTIGFLLRNKDAAVAPDSHFAAMDIGWAQELLGRSGTLDSVSLRLTESADPKKVVTALRKIVPPDATVAAPAQRGEAIGKMLAGFQLNLAAMSLVSLLVGMFLIYNTIEASVVRRRSEIGILRSLGATRAEIRWLFLGEAAVLGLLGIGAGMIGGYFLARALVGTVAETISSLYVLVHVQQLAIPPWIWISAFLLGLGSVLIAAWLPANGAAATDPVQALHGGLRVERSAHLSRRWILGGALSLGVAAALSVLALKTGPPWLGFGAAFFVLAGFSLAAPELISRFSRLLRSRLHRRIEPLLAAQNLGRALLRNSVTIASLAAAVAMTVGVAVMVFSFRQTVASWVDQTLVADLFIGPAANEIAGPNSFMPPEALHFLETNPAVDAVDTFRALELAYGNATISVAVVRGSNRRNLRFLHGNSDEIMPRFYHEQSVLVSESFARRYHVRAGGTLLLPTPSGRVAFPILGVFYNYTNDQGLVFLSEKNFRELWHDDRVNSVAVYLKPDASPEVVGAAFRKRFSHRGEFSIYSNRALRTRIFEIFDQTFAVTYVLRTIAVVVAVVGIFLGLTTLVAERSHELGVLRAIGASAAQVQRLLLWESGMIGLLASVLGIAAGLCLAIVLTGVINRAFFGWTIQLAFPWVSLAWTPLWIVAAAVFAGWIPAWRAGRLNVSEAVRSE